MEDTAGSTGKKTADADITVKEDEIVVELSIAEELSDKPVRVKGTEYELVDFDSVPPMIELPLEKLNFNRYEIRENPADNYPQPILDKLISRGYTSTFPTVRPIGNGEYEVLNGHKRIDVAERVDMGAIPVHVEELNDWEAMQYWAEAHLPLPNTSGAEEAGFYTGEERGEVVKRLLEDWPEERLRQLDRIDNIL